MRDHKLIQVIWESISYKTHIVSVYRRNYPNEAIYILLCSKKKLEGITWILVKNPKAESESEVDY